MSVLERIREFRRKNLMALVAREGGHGAQRKFAGLTGIPYTFINNLLRGEKPVSEETARKIEQALSLPVGWMDSDHVGEASCEAANDSGLSMMVSEEERRIILAYREMSLKKQDAFKTVADSFTEPKVKDDDCANTNS